MTLINQTTRLAFAALIHDLGKLTERAKINYPQSEIALAQQLYCPTKKTNGYSFPTHKHAAFTALSLEEINPSLPVLKGTDFSPFAHSESRDADDSLINAAAKHHKPDTLLQWIIAKADRVASGFEREQFDAYNLADEKTETGKNHYQARLLSLFELIDISQQKDISPAQLQYRIPLQPLTVKSQFPLKRTQCEPADDSQAQQEYAKLWSAFKQALDTIPTATQAQLPLWLEHFDSLLLQYCHAIPSATAFGARPDVSLYDHSKAVTALATALWRYIEETNQHQQAHQALSRFDKQFDQQPIYTLIQGDFFGIQNFIFNDDEAGNSQKHAARLMRGRSFQISLLSELAAVKLLDALELPGTSQIINAAGKFMIIAPNTERTHQTLTKIQQEISTWFLEQTYGQSGIGLVSVNACHEDFLTKSTDKNTGFSGLLSRLFEQLEIAKYQRYNLTSTQQSPVFEDYLARVQKAGGVCAINGRYPADGNLQETKLARLTQDQITLGKLLADPSNSHLIIYNKPPHKSDLKLSMLGYYVRIASADTAHKITNSQAELKDISRMFDIALPPTKDDEPIFKGYAKRFINAYVPLFSHHDLLLKERYSKLDAEEQLFTQGDSKTLHHLAAEDRQMKADEKWVGISALHTLKGDIDNLGLIFQQGLTTPSSAHSRQHQRSITFAKMASLSRQLNQFFTVYLPWLCQNRFPNSYTVFAGGDDFFLIGPWKKQLELAKTLREDFANFTAQNPQLSFSAGLSLTKAKLPIRQMAKFAEESLEQAKQHENSITKQTKNAISLFNTPFNWDELNQIYAAYNALLDLQFDHNQLLSTGYIYGLLELCDMGYRAKNPSSKPNPRDFSWRSKLVYRTQRLIKDKTEKQAVADQLISLIGNEINKHPLAFKAVIQLYLYSHRA
ncbi:type III-A CRISPR-associated protein Cas10/Csm1 [Thiomicrospira sp. R3]|uniref:type III-A CRISPR-associated protein Cas10/Csm1 n=1 Tax=Thiomicrospira sp. R3 TaxID=3035472 RepID=UPI00259BA60C|nr:type III-A CRISPR-associated protein Cas10/Csm1 [Thiomicrospira sp. R3]WFE69475.1 type III-A CRISPR-associated protein Cas10/Csm1 [Thiomicrospira sp. R3]